MERTGLLIERLQTQYHDNAGRKNLVITAQLLLSELQKNDEENGEPSSAAVSVFYPAFYEFADEVKETIAELPPVENVTTTKQEEAIAEPQVNGEKQTNAESHYDPIMDIPTLALKQQEVNDTIAANNESINDKLKSLPQKEIGHSIKDTPVKDLRKAIGINDRYTFINELFRGDETMYERSIKTINGYSNYAEAEFWIKRELKLKLGWNDDTETVQLFDKLVKRRFI